jgi:hypothetical protein
MYEGFVNGWLQLDNAKRSEKKGVIEGGVFEVLIPSGGSEVARAHVRLE